MIFDENLHELWKINLKKPKGHTVYEKGVAWKVVFLD